MQKIKINKTLVGSDTHRALCVADITIVAEAMRKPSGARREKQVS